MKPLFAIGETVGVCCLIQPPIIIPATVVTACTFYKKGQPIRPVTNMVEHILMPRMKCDLYVYEVDKCEYKLPENALRKLFPGDYDEPEEETHIRDRKITLDTRHKNIV